MTITTAQAGQQPNDEAEFELISSDGVCVAGTIGDRDDAWNELMRYAPQYAEEGPLTIYEVKRIPVTSDRAAVSSLSAGTEPDAQLCKFYGVTTFPELVAAMLHHIEKLQAKLPPTPNVFAPQRVREG